MRPNETPFPTRWWGIDLPGYRDCSVTYCAFEYDSLPPVSECDLNGSFAYLADYLPPQARRCGYSDETRREWRDDFERLVESAGPIGVTIPPAFLKYIRDELYLKVRFSRGGYYGWPDRIERSPKGNDLFLFLFLRDSQDSLLWYLCLDRTNGDHCVVSSMDYFGCNFDHEPQTPDEPDNVFFAAGSFDAFIYRTWIENQIWFAHKYNRELTDRELTYCHNYSQGR